jgi:elongator complex protein 3
MLYMDDKKTFEGIINAIVKTSDISAENIQKIFFKHPNSKGNIPRKSAVLFAYKTLKDSKELKVSAKDDRKVLSALQLKKTRTLSGVTPVTVLTKPFPCPGDCIFCPSDMRMPKSYLSSEPGAQRASANKFDPYLQTYNRLVAYNAIGHPTDKVELIILGGTWSAYFEEYQFWFVKRCLEALNAFDPNSSPKTLDPNKEMPFDVAELDENSTNYNKQVAKAQRMATAKGTTWEKLRAVQRKNETAKTRCVGLVVETRPDYLTTAEILRIRRLGATKVQLGVQSLNASVLKKNKRGHTVEDTARAFSLLRQAGFKIHAHWMPNLYGSTPKKDVADFKKLFEDLQFKPDELKIYPCSLIETAALMKYYTAGKWRPYSEEELLGVLQEVFKITPRYCRITRVIRDISSDDIVVGNKKTNFRQIVEASLKKDKFVPEEIRSREIRGRKIPKKIELKTTEYETSVSKEIFMEYVTADDLLLGFLRLSLPKESSFVSELGKNAIIREVHVYGQSLELGSSDKSKSQHRGLGTNLIKEAVRVSKLAGYTRLSVISAIGTRGYYKKQGFTDGEIYQHYLLK